MVRQQATADDEASGAISTAAPRSNAPGGRVGSEVMTRDGTASPGRRSFRSQGLAQPQRKVMADEAATDDRVQVLFVIRAAEESDATLKAKSTPTPAETK